MQERYEPMFNSYPGIGVSSRGNRVVQTLLKSAKGRYTVSRVGSKEPFLSKNTVLIKLLPVR